MLARLRSLTLRARLLLLGVGATTALVALAAVSLTQTSGKSGHERLTVLLVAGFGVVAVGGLTIATIRSMASGVTQIEARLTAISQATSERLLVALRALADGNFALRLEAKTKPTEITRGDELGDIARTIEAVRDAIISCYDAYNASTEQLRGLIGKVSSTAASVDGTSQQMASNSDETGKATAEVAQAIEHVAQGAERQVQMIDTAKRAADEVAAAVSETAQQAEQTAEVAALARSSTEQGVAAAEQADTAMRSVRESSEAVSVAIGQLAAKSEQIGAIVSTITGIAEQTNLLALNAAIEAARAGEQGRGFAVVAEEVRKLAEESQHAAHEISDLIGAMQDETSSVVAVVEDGTTRTADGVTVVAQAREAFVSIGQAVDDMTARVEQIAAASQEITASAASMQESIAEAASVAEESSASTEQVSASTEQTSASTEEIAASAQELAHDAASLEELVARFRLQA
jgi:methyl-accepting chemotaxis protein